MVRKKNLLIVTSTFPRFDRDVVSARFIYDLAIALRVYYNVHILTPDSSDLGQQDRMGGLVVHRFVYLFPRRMQSLTTGDGILANIRRRRLLICELPFLFLSELLHLVKIIRSEEIEVVNAHWIIPQGLCVALIKRFIDVRFILTVHAAGIFTLKRWKAFGRFLARFIIRQADMIMPVSKYIKDTVRQLTGMDFAYRIVSMGVDLERFSPFDKKSDLVFTYLFVGKLVEKKGVNFLLEAVKEVCTDVDNFRVLIAGGGLLMQQMKDYAFKLGISKKVEFLGWVNNADLSRIYNESDVLVVPSVFDSKGETEGMPTVIPEAMACGVPVVASAISGIVDIVKDGYNGWLARPGDRDDLADKMKLAYRNEGLRDYRKNCIETALAHSWQEKAEVYHNVLEMIS